MCSFHVFEEKCTTTTSTNTNFIPFFLFYYLFLFRKAECVFMIFCEDVILEINCSFSSMCFVLIISQSNELKPRLKRIFFSFFFVRLVDDIHELSMYTISDHFKTEVFSFNQLNLLIGCKVHTDYSYMSSYENNFVCACSKCSKFYFFFFCCSHQCKLRKELKRRYAIISAQTTTTTK